ncbi:helix-turn-helix domain-containing protein [Acinetobacter sp. LoGeW2-3]|uniref:helix-turn-helix domain-containing protein n=1 Tax=Acinetobacter sp. LoGeW2-3 TaxID=1808001 RepID=UPI001D1894A6|nr:helix-turn-helix domain-containing protein [Acinetobacter sp. LoGeW2-3]
MMALRDLKQTDESQQNHLLKDFIEAPLDQNFGHEVVAMYLGCSPWTLARMRCNGSELPYTKIGRRIAYKKRDVLAYEKSRTTTCTAQYA